MSHPLIATGSNDTTIRIWNAKTYELVRELRGHEGGVEDLAWTEDGRLLASGSTDGTVRVWQPRLGLLWIAKGPLTAVERIAWRPDGMSLAASSRDGSIFVWNVNAVVLAGHQAPVSQVAWSPNGQYLASSSWDFEVRLWKMPEGKFLYSFGRHQNHTDTESSVIEWNPKISQLAAAGAGVLRVLNIGERFEEKVLRGQIGYVNDLSWGPEGKKLSVLIWDKKLITLDAENAEELQSVSFEFSDPYSLRSSSDAYSWSLSWTDKGISLLSSLISIKGGLAVWGIENRYPLWEDLTIDQGIITATWSPSGRVIAARPKLYPIEIRDGASGTVLRRMLQEGGN